jgi:CRISPR-associated protein Cas5d
VNCKEYVVSFEIAGPAAIFARPDSGATFVSYPAPTYSALKGMFECVARWESAYIRPASVEICAPLQYLQYATNYGGPLRKRGTSNYQLFATILVDVCYKVSGVATAVGPAPQGNNHLHALQSVFSRRLASGQLYRTPCLGWSEFVPSYFGPVRDNTRCCTEIEMILPSMLHSVFDRDSHGKVDPSFHNSVRIEQGVLSFAE